MARQKTPAKVRRCQSVYSSASSCLFEFEKGTDQMDTRKDVFPSHTRILGEFLPLTLDLLDHDAVLEIDIVPVDILEDASHRFFRLVLLLFPGIVPRRLGYERDKDDPDAERDPFRVDRFQVILRVRLQCQRPLREDRIDLVAENASRSSPR